LFKKVTKKLDTGEIQILFPDGIICGRKLINSDKILKINKHLILGVMTGSLSDDILPPHLS
jgi:hypothetical protein